MLGLCFMLRGLGAFSIRRKGLMFLCCMPLWVFGARVLQKRWICLSWQKITVPKMGKFVKILASESEPSYIYIYIC